MLWISAAIVLLLGCAPASAEHAGGAPWTLADAAAHMDEEPERAASILRAEAVSDDLAAFHLMVLLHTWLPQTRETQAELRRLFETVLTRVEPHEARETPAPSRPELPQADIDTPTLVEALRYLSARGSFAPGRRPVISCPTLRRDPGLIEALYPAVRGFANALLPDADCTDAALALPPPVEAYLARIAEMAGAFGTPAAQRGGLEFARLRRYRDILARVLPERLLDRPLPDGATVPPAGRPLETWSMLALSNRRVYERYSALYDAAMPALVRHYRDRFGMTEAAATRAAWTALRLSMVETPWAPPQRSGLRYMILSDAPVDRIAALIDTAPSRQDVPMTMIGMAWPYSWTEAGGPDPLISVSVHRPEVLRVLLGDGPLAGSVADDQRRGNQIVDPNARSRIGKTPLMTAAEIDQFESVRILLDHGADPNAATGDAPLIHGSRTALMYAATNASAPVIEALLAAGADPQHRDSRGYTAGDYLIGRGPTHANRKLTVADLTRLSTLLPPGSRPDGTTALTRAVTDGDASTVTELLDAGADPNLKDDNGRTAIDYLQGRDRSDRYQLISDAERYRLVRHMAGLETSPTLRGTPPPPAADGSPAWLPDDAVEHMHEDPERAAATLRAEAPFSDESAFQLMVLLREWLPHTRENRRELRLLIADTFERIAGYDDEVPDSPVAPRLPLGNDISMDDFAGILTYVGLRGRFPEPPAVSCVTLRNNPAYADVDVAILRGETDTEIPPYGPADFGMPSLECLDPDMPLPPAVEAYFRATKTSYWKSGLERVSGWYGNIISRGNAVKWRRIHILPRRLLDERSGTHRPFEGWSMLSLANRPKFEALMVLYEPALTALKQHYRTVFGMSEANADRAARVALLLPTNEGHWWAADHKGLRYMILDGAPVADIAAVIDAAPSRTEVPMTLLRMQYYGPAWDYVGGRPDPLISMSVHRPDVLRLLLDKGPFAPPFADELQRGDQTVDPNARNPIGKTPLMTAAEIDQMESVRILLDHGAGPNAALDGRALRHGHRTALMYAAAYASAPVIEALLDAGADPAVVDSQGFNADDYLNGRGPSGPNRKLTAKEIDRLSARLPASVHRTDGRTALMLAAAQTTGDVVGQLLDAGADPKMTDAQGLTALDYAKGLSPLGQNQAHLMMDQDSAADVLERR